VAYYDGGVEISRIYWENNKPCKQSV